jgi:serine-type D-Ala-D-Ala endopeptidase (penicillin-binding protein 7)
VQLFANRRYALVASLATAWLVATGGATVASAPAAQQPATYGVAARVTTAADLSLRRDLLGNLVPDVDAAAAIVYVPETQEVIWEENAHDQRSIASLTKVMTALTFIAADPDLSQRVTIVRSDVRDASVTYLRRGERVALDDVLHLALIASDNGAARVLARTAPGGTAAFVTRMNAMAAHFGLANTHYADPSGLDPRNVSSAYDLSHLIGIAVSETRLGPIMRTAEYVVHTSRHSFTIHSTNKLLGTDLDVRGGKTGFIHRAGYCLATLLEMPQGTQVAVVVLGARTSAKRFADVRDLFDWVVGRSEGLLGGVRRDVRQPLEPLRVPR